MMHTIRHPSPPTPARGDLVVLSRKTLLGAAAGALAALAWAGGATWYIAAHDELAQRVFVRETEMRYAYEDRIGSLSGRLEHELTRNMVERTGFEARVNALAARQRELETRQGWLRTAAERLGAAPRVAAGPNDTTSDAQRSLRLGVTGTDGKPAPLSDNSGLYLRDGEGEKARPRDRLSALELSAERLTGEHPEFVAGLGAVARGRLARLRSAIDATGISPVRSRIADKGLGGPLVALDPAALPGMGAAAELDITLAALSEAQAIVRTLPLGLPLAGDVEQTSPFGYRVDPFTRGPALHTGLDFRAETGTAARAAGAGQVVAAEYAAGYGNMVEIDHGGGVATRYGHLSSVSVTPGERVEAGQIVGRTGSTVRSTGPHLHYETRIGGEPVNPLRFIAAGRLLGRDGG